MARTVSPLKSADDRLVLDLPWGKFTVRRATRSVLRAVHGAQAQAEALGDSPDPDEGAKQIADLLDKALEGDGFLAGFDAAWEADTLTQHDVVAIASVVMDELNGGAAAGEA